MVGGMADHPQRGASVDALTPLTVLSALGKVMAAPVTARGTEPWDSTACPSGPPAATR